jgi:hypothetical protein
MNCQTCADLLAAWEDAVRTYTDFGLRGHKILADNLRLAIMEEERLRVNCSVARDALMARRSQHHA